MEYTTLGSTGLRVSVMGLGCGGPSALGANTHKNESESVRVVLAALDCGVNIIDTAEYYGTESIVGRALREVRRDKVVVSTKRNMWERKLLERPEDTVAALDNSLSRLDTDYVDIYHLHAVPPGIYEQVRDRIVPVLETLRDAGKIRFLGITEIFERDPGHVMLQKAVHDGCWDVMMVGFNMLNQCARDRVLRATMDAGIGTLNMFALRRAFSRPVRLKELLQELRDRGRIGAGLETQDDLMRLLFPDGDRTSLPDAAYRFCRHEPGIDVVLSGTGSVDHVRANADSLTRPDLPAEVRARIEQVFAGVDDVSGS